MKPTNPGFYWFCNNFNGHSWWEPVQINMEEGQLVYYTFGWDNPDPISITKDEDWGEEIKHE